MQEKRGTEDNIVFYIEYYFFFVKVRIQYFKVVAVHFMSNIGLKAKTFTPGATHTAYHGPADGIFSNVVTLSS